jgi:U3 small nucleolar RNA-associated protein 20
MKRGKKMDSLVIYAKEVLNSAIGDIDHTSVLEAGDWEIIYFCLHAIEKVGEASESLLWNESDLWKSTIACLAHAHPWVQLISSRIIHTHFSSCTGNQFEKSSNKSAASSLAKEAGLLFEIVRNLCFEINSEEEHQSEKITTMAIKNLLWIVNLMESHPQLFLNDRELEGDVSGDEDDEEMIVSKNPLTWLITRLSNIAKKRGVFRRKAVFKAFAAIASVSDEELLENHLELMIEPLNRVIVETEARDEHVAVSRKHMSSNFSSESEADLPREVLELLEDKVGTEMFINALSSVKSKAREKRESRKQAIAREAISDPEKAAKRKISKQQKEKSRKKRRIQEKKKGRGVFTSKPRL